MLARPGKFQCVECGLSCESEDFHLHYGRLENGPAYWSDRGLLCSPKCSLAHHRKRVEDGTDRREPAADPFGDGAVRPRR